MSRTDNRMDKWKDARRRWAIRVLGEEYETLKRKALARDAAAVQASLKQGECDDLQRQLADCQVEMAALQVERSLDDQRIKEAHTCRSKQAFGSEEAAEWAAVALYRRDGRILSSYTCPNCGRWHHTSGQKATGLLRKEIARERAAARGTAKAIDLLMIDLLATQGQDSGES